ncbi:MAG: DVUA0089 family protein [Burkholderiales bacterium]
MRLPIAALLACCITAPAQALDYAFTGTFTRDDDVRFVDFSVGYLSWVTFRTHSYAGGTNIAGQAIPAGGFDTVVTVFASDGRLLSGSDDGLGSAEDPLTHRRYDTLFRLLLASGDYVAAITQYDNTALGPTLAGGFKREGEGNFTPTLTYCEALRFCDVSGSLPYNQRDGHWSLDVLNVNEAILASAPVPEPATWGLLLGGLALLAARLGARRRGRSHGH